ncbi:hypothetical protein SGLAM104S_00372 [Streptomyces glaucescens]
MSSWGSPSGRDQYPLIFQGDGRPVEDGDAVVGPMRSHHGWNMILVAGFVPRSRQTLEGRRATSPTSCRSLSRVSRSVEYTIVPTMPRVSSTL